MNSFDLMIEKYSKELIETGKKTMMSAVAEEKTEVSSDNALDVEMNRDNNFAESVVSENLLDKTVMDKAMGSDGSGRLKIQTFAADGVYPVVAANVIVYKGGEAEPYFEGYTDGSGIVDNIILPAPVGVDTDLPPETEPFYKYDIEITHPKFLTKKYKNVPVFDNISSIQTVRLIPKTNGFDEDGEIIESENEELMKREDA